MPATPTYEPHSHAQTYSHTHLSHPPLGGQQLGVAGMGTRQDPEQSGDKGMALAGGCRKD